MADCACDFTDGHDEGIDRYRYIFAGGPEVRALLLGLLLSLSFRSSFSSDIL